MSELIEHIRNYVDVILRKRQCIVCTQCTVRSVLLAYKGLYSRTPQGGANLQRKSVHAFLLGNGRRMWAVLTITGRVDVLGKETESQVEMGTVGSVRGVRGRILALLSDESKGQLAEEASGKTS